MTFQILPWSSTKVPDLVELDRMFNRTKGQLFFQPGAGFLGSLLCDMDFIWDDDCDTAWCDGDRIGWNPQFFCWLTPQERITILAHELWHAGYMHCDQGRVGKRCHDYWNKAADHVINLRLKQDGYVFGEKLMSIGPYMDYKFRDMSTEAIYEALNPPPFGKPQPQPGGNPGSSSGTQPSQGNTDGPPSSPLQDIRVSSGTMEQAIAKVIKATQASKRAGEAGVVPGETELIISEFLEPILPWEVLLQRYMTEMTKDDYSWKRPSRRYEDEYLPSPDGDNGLEHIIYYLDVSGSVTDAQIQRFNSEVKFIHEQLQPKRLTLVTFDTQLHDFYEFTDEDAFDKISVTGRGGTSLVEVQEHIQKHKPSAAVVFSDLYCTPMKEDPGSPVLWVVVGNSKAKIRFGQAIHIKNE